ncbi:hypothetical protein TOPH_07960 [Tolypocladium ophioglossoides CBS 100239]|uniref:Uncharacterized protein n=1 Tax=Tolypocladium ophioglossoides (strain CBS 100239) TaxID=1163406 RepID=A0A0L0N004_TOLOC|nr:hypothetical protein TOPH_07960 [Tolypocladium ophioglossoides CBS 100239]
MQQHPRPPHDGHGGVVGQCYHSEVAGDGKDVDRGGSLLADVDLLVGDVVADGQGLYVEKSAIRLACDAHIGTRVQAYRCYADPAWEHEARVFESAGEGENGEGEAHTRDTREDTTEYTHPDGSERPLGQGIRHRVLAMVKVAVGTQRQRGSTRAHNKHAVWAGQQAQKELQRLGQPPPERGEDGAEAEGEEPGVPGRGHIEDDGDARLEEGRVDGGGRGRERGRRRGRGRGRCRYRYSRRGSGGGGDGMRRRWLVGGGCRSDERGPVVRAGRRRRHGTFRPWGEGERQQDAWRVYREAGSAWLTGCTEVSCPIVAEAEMREERQPRPWEQGISNNRGPRGGLRGGHGDSLLIIFTARSSLAAAAIGRRHVQLIPRRGLYCLPSGRPTSVVLRARDAAKESV